MLDYRIVDSPGLNDQGLTRVDWVKNLHLFNSDGNRVALVLVCFKASIRPDTNDQSNLLHIHETLSKCESSNIGIIFTFSDKINMNEEILND